MVANGTILDISSVRYASKRLCVIITFFLQLGDMQRHKDENVHLQSTATVV